MVTSPRISFSSNELRETAVCNSCSAGRSIVRTAAWRAGLAHWERQDRVRAR